MIGVSGQRRERHYPENNMKMKKTYVVYDSRAYYQDTDDCSILLSTDNVKEAKLCAIKENGVVYQYNVKLGEDNKMWLVDEEKL